MHEVALENMGRIPELMDKIQELMGEIQELMDEIQELMDEIQELMYGDSGSYGKQVLLELLRN